MASQYAGIYTDNNFSVPGIAVAIRARRNSENSEILTLPDFQIGRLFEILTLKIGRKPFAERLCFAMYWPETDLKIRETLQNQSNIVCRNFNFQYEYKAART